MNGSSGSKYVTQTMPRKAVSVACARGFLLPTRTRLTFTEGGQNDSCPARRELGPISWKKQEWRQSLIHNVYFFLKNCFWKFPMLSIQIQWPASASTALFSSLLSLNAVIASQIHAPDSQFLKFFSNPRMEISPSLWTSLCDAMAVTPSLLHPFHIFFSLRPRLCSSSVLSTRVRAAGCLE